MTIKELTKEKFLIRKSDPQRASVLGILIADAKEIAKKDGDREASFEDIALVAKRNAKSMEKAIKDVSKNGGGLGNAIKEMEEEVAIYKSFLPKQLSAEESIRMAVDVLSLFKEEQRTKKIFGEIMKGLPSNVDKGAVSGFLQKELK